jgi:hypothetical protein
VNERQFVLVLKTAAAASQCHVTAQYLRTKAARTAEMRSNGRNHRDFLVFRVAVRTHKTRKFCVHTQSVDLSRASTTTCIAHTARFRTVSRRLATHQDLAARAKVIDYGE